MSYRLPGFNFRFDWKEPYDGGTRWVFRWGEVYTGKLRGLAIKVSRFYSEHTVLHLGLIFIDIYLHVEKYMKFPTEEYGFGFSFTDSAIHWSWKHKTKVFNYPWNYELVRRWEKVKNTWGDDMYWIEVPQPMHYGTIATRKIADYRYVLNNGTIQNVKAIYFLNKSEYRWRWFKFLPFPRKIYTNIQIDFSDEIGERTGSWKGGTVGCSYELLPNETPEQALKRMESERKF